MGWNNRNKLEIINKNNCLIILASSDSNLIDTSSMLAFNGLQSSGFKAFCIYYAAHYIIALIVQSNPKETVFFVHSVKRLYAVLYSVFKECGIMPLKWERFIRIVLECLRTAHDCTSRVQRTLSNRYLYSISIRAVKCIDSTDTMYK